MTMKRVFEIMKFHEAINKTKRIVFYSKDKRGKVFICTHCRSSRPDTHITHMHARTPAKTLVVVLTLSQIQHSTFTLSADPAQIYKNAINVLNV